MTSLLTTKNRKKLRWFKLYSLFFKSREIKVWSSFSPDDSSVEEGEDEVKGDWTPGHQMVHPRPEVSLQSKLSVQTHVRHRAAINYSKLPPCNKKGHGPELWQIQIQLLTRDLIPILHKWQFMSLCPWRRTHTTWRRAVNQHNQHCTVKKLE